MLHVIPNNLFYNLYLNVIKAKKYNYLRFSLLNFSIYIIEKNIESLEKCQNKYLNNKMEN